MEVEEQEQKPEAQEKLATEGPPEDVKRKKMTLALLMPQQEKEVYEILTDLIGKHHEHLKNAKISVLAKLNCSEDVEGKQQIVKTTLVKEDTQLLIAAATGEDVAPDFLVLVNGSTWLRLDARQKAYLLDQECCRMGVATSRDGDYQQREDGRLAYRLRKPEFSGFAAPIKRHGANVMRATQGFVAVVASSDGIQMVLQAPAPAETAVH